MRVNPLFYNLLAVPPLGLARRMARRVGRDWQTAAKRRRDFARPTYALNKPPVAELHSYFPALPLETLRPHADWIADLSANFVAGRFDLLGSGWTAVRYGMSCRGLEGNVYPPPDFETDAAGNWLKNQVTAPNLAESRRLWNRLDSDYAPIDWQRDFISGARWSAKTWHKNIAYGKLPGADVKVPWELARMQHLPTLAWALALAKAGEPNFQSPEIYARAFRNQILDFIATNPPRFGVNWSCTMDVAIRVSNWLVAYDLMRKYGAEFDAEWERIFRRSVWDHANFIAHHLEWSDILRGNHYLADVAGLLFCAAYLPRSEESDRWLMLAVTELNREIGLQFLPDGANFEGSTAYHRLSGEIALYSVALMMTLTDTNREGGRRCSLPLHLVPGTSSWSPCSPDNFKRLRGIAQFITGITRPDGTIPQIGDNDSGRFLKLQPAVVRNEAGEWAEVSTDCRHLVAAVSGLFDDEEYRTFAGEEWFEYALVQRLTDLAPAVYYDDFPEPADTKRWVGKNDFDSTRFLCYEWPAAGPDIRHNLQWNAFPDFGLYVWRSPRLYLAIRCGRIGQNGVGGHSHNDQLAIELWLDGEPLVADPGTFVYTPLPAERNAYRSVRAHHAPMIDGIEPGDMTRGLFALGDAAQAKAEKFSPYGFVGTHKGYGFAVTRIIEIEANIVRIKDYSSGLPLADPQPDKRPYSDGYGKKVLGVRC